MTTRPAGPTTVHSLIARTMAGSYHIIAEATINFAVGVGPKRPRDNGSWGRSVRRSKRRRAREKYRMLQAMSEIRDAPGESAGSAARTIAFPEEQMRVMQATPAGNEMPPK